MRRFRARQRVARPGISLSVETHVGKESRLGIRSHADWLPSRSNDRAHIERFNRTIQEEYPACAPGNSEKGRTLCPRDRLSDEQWLCGPGGL